MTKQELIEKITAEVNFYQLEIHKYPHMRDYLGGVYNMALDCLILAKQLDEPRECVLVERNPNRKVCDGCWVVIEDEKSAWTNNPITNDREYIKTSFCPNCGSKIKR